MNGIIAYILGKKYTDQKVSELPTPYKVKPAVNNYSDLPSSGNTAGDVRKVISEDGKEYYWDGTAWEVMGANTPKENVFRYTTMPSAGADNVGQIVQYIGADTEDYKSGYYYICTASETDPVTYSWTRKNVQPEGSATWGNVGGTLADQADLITVLNEKGTYSKPSGGIPKADLAEAIRNIIDNAEQTTRMVNVINHNSDDGHYPSAKAVYNATNVMFINAHANIDSYGTVTGANIYHKGASCTLTAVANSGYSFVKWKITGTSTELSTNPTYTFDVEDSLDITAVFKDDALQIVSWADGTDAQITAMVDAADNGVLSLSDYWSVGDARTVTLEAMAADAAKGYEAHASQDVELVLEEYQYCTGIKLVSTGEKPNFIVGQKHGLLETGQMNSSSTNAGGWGACKRRGWCNDVYRLAIPSTLRGIFKQFTWQYVKSGTEGELLTANDYFAMTPERAIFPTRTYSREEEWALFNQWAWYQTAANRIKKAGPSGSASGWWECSPGSGNSYSFCSVSTSGGADWGFASGSYLLAPFGCI